MQHRIARTVLGFLIGGLISVPLTVLIVLIMQSIKPFGSGQLIGGIILAIFIIPAAVSFLAAITGAVVGAAKGINLLKLTLLLYQLDFLLFIITLIMLVNSTMWIKLIIG